MPRPCTCDNFIPKEAFVPGRDCRVCWLFHNEPAYHELYGGNAEVSGICKHRGESTGGTIECPSCTGHVKVKLFLCSIHSQCTLVKKVENTACCHQCLDYSSK